MRDEPVGLLIDRALVGAGAVIVHDRGPLLFMLAGKPNICGDTGLVELEITGRLGDGLELASA